MKKKIKLTLNFSLRTYAILCCCALFLFSFVVYFFSEESKISVLTCSGNSYYTDQEIYQQISLSLDSRITFIPAFTMEEKIEELPLVKSATVTKSNRQLQIRVEEYTVIGYYVDGDANYAMVKDHSDIQLDEDHISKIVHFPLYTGFTSKQRKEIKAIFKEHDDLDKSIIERMSEVIPYESTYDENMLQITMRDGNTVYTSLSSLHMLSKYQGVLSQLKGKYACLMLDGENSAIEKVNCDEFDLEKQKEEQKEKEEQEAKEDNQDTQDSTQDEASQEQETDSQQSYLDQANDWQTDSTWGLYYSATLDLYYDPGTMKYYRWNDTSLSFDEVN